MIEEVCGEIFGEFPKKTTYFEEFLEYFVNDYLQELFAKIICKNCEKYP